LFKKMKSIQALGLILLVAGIYAKCQNGYECCKSCDVVFTDDDGEWGVEDGQWCGIDKEKCNGSSATNDECWSKALGYDCCKEGTDVIYTDESGKWGMDGDDWCGIIETVDTEDSCGLYPCCSTCTSVFEDKDGKWGVENEEWCLIKKSCEKEDTATTTKATEPTKKPEAGVTRTTLADGGVLESGIFSTLPPSHTQPPYPHAENTGLASCGSKWTMVDNVCVAMYCEDNLSSENCDDCGGVAGEGSCVSVDPALCKSGIWPEVHSSTDQPWKYSRSTHFGLTYGGACGFGLYGLCTTKFNETGELCVRFCEHYPDLCKDPDDITLRGHFCAPIGNYYTQFWSSLPGDYDNYLSCGECYEVERTLPDGSSYPAGEGTDHIILQVVDSCPCTANAKWCCGSGVDHCNEIDFKYGCPIPEGSWHVDLSDIAMSRLQTNDPYGVMVDGVIPIKYKRVPCPVKGNIHVWLRPGAGPWYFALTVVNVANMGSLVAVEVQQADGVWVPLVRDPNYSSTRPQERYGSWTVKQGTGPFTVPMNMRFTDSAFNTLTAEGAIKDWGDPDFDMFDFLYIDTGVQFPMPETD
jgi:hypothetical protein